MKKLFETPMKAVISMTCIFAVVMIVAISGVYGAFSKELNEIKNSQNNPTEAGQVAEGEAEPAAPEGEAVPDAEPAEPAPEADANAQSAEQPAEQQPEPQAEQPAEQPIVDGNQTLVQQDSLQQPQTKPQNNSNGNIGIKKAKKKALADAGISKSAVKYTKAHLDYDDGIAIYDVEFYTDTHEYEYEINAKTGKVHEKSIERHNKVYNTQNNTSSKPKVTAKPQTNNNNNNKNNSNRISVDKAKSIAVKHAGYSVGKVTFQKAKLDYDDGRAVYEIDFFVGNDEYDYEIDAKTGKILDYDFDKNERYDDDYDDDWDDDCDDDWEYHHGNHHDD